MTRADHAWVDLYPETECNNGLNVVTQHFLTNAVKSLSDGAPRRVDMIDPPDPASRTVAEYALKPGQILNFGVGGMASCLRGGSFLLQPAKQYEVAVSPGCLITVHELVLKEGVARREPFRRVGPMICKKAY